MKKGVAMFKIRQDEAARSRSVPARPDDFTITFSEPGLGIRPAALAPAAGFGSAEPTSAWPARRSDRELDPSPGDAGPPILYPDGTVTFTVHDFQTGTNFVASFHCPLYSGRHARPAELLDGHRAWARAFDLFADDDDYARFCAARFDDLVSAQRHMLSLEAALVVSHLMTWFFVYDDVQERQDARNLGGSTVTHRAVRRHLEVLDGDSPRARDSPTLFAFADLLRQARQLDASDDEWYRRTVEHLREYLYGTLGEGSLDPPTGANTALHWQVRQLTAGVPPGCVLTAGALRIVPSFGTGDVFVRRMEQLNINYNVWINDLLGLNRDQRDGLHNTILILRNEFGLSLEQATRMSAHHSDQELRAFLNIERELPRLLGETWRSEAANIAAYGEVLKGCMRGLVDWTASSHRYLAAKDMSLRGG
jgi:hypothetical protein